MLGVGVGGTQILAFLDVGIGKAKLWRWGSKPTPGPNANGFTSQWNIGFTSKFCKIDISVPISFFDISCVLIFS